MPLTVRCYRRPWRALAAALLVISRASLPWILWRVLTANDPPISPPMLAEMLLVVAVLPGAAAWMIGRAVRAEARAAGGELRIEQAGSSAAVSAAAVAAWRLPLPEPGIDLQLADGRRVPFSVAARDPSPLAAALDPSAAAHPTLVYSAARRPAPRWHYYVGRYVVFALAPAAVLFNAHQHIAYGGFWGEYYLMGAGAWLRTAAIYWTTVGVYLLLYASLWRGLAEAASLLAAWTAPAAARAVRGAAEWVATAAFYGGVPAILALRFWG
jgi:apolipoprotein N-acyltransferase